MLCSMVTSAFRDDRFRRYVARTSVIGREITLYAVW